MDLFSNPITFFWQLLIFLAVYLSLSTFVFRPYLEIYRKRRELTDQRLASAAKLEEESAGKAQTLEQKLSETHRQAHEIREKFKLEGRDNERRILQAAREEGARLYNQAVAAQQQDAAKARQSLSGMVNEHEKQIRQKVENI